MNSTLSYILKPCMFALFTIYLFIVQCIKPTSVQYCYFTVMLFFFFFFFFASPWQWEPTGVSVLFVCFFFLFFSAGLSGKRCPFPCFLILLGFFPALYFIQHKYLLVPTVMAGQHLLCHPYKALLYVQ